MKEKPKLYKNKISKIINNNMNSCYLKNIEEKNDNKINEMLNNNKIYDIKVEIKTKNNTYNTYIISKTKDSIYIIEDIKIPISEIVSIKLNT